MSKPRLTPHQREVFSAIERACRRLHTDAVEADVIGCWSAVVHLEEKGYVVREHYRGQRGGEHYRIRPLTNTAAMSLEAGLR